MCMFILAWIMMNVDFERGHVKSSEQISTHVTNLCFRTSKAGSKRSIKVSISTMNHFAASTGLLDLYLKS